MNIARRAAALAVAAAALSGLTLATAPAHASTTTKSIQSESDNLNIDTYDGNWVLTRDPSLTYQNFNFLQVGWTPEGTGIYLIQGTTFGTCLQDYGVNQPVHQAPCSPNNLAQRWVVDMGQEHTTIANEKYRNEVLQSNGWDQPVTASFATNGPNQEWTLYDK